MTHGKSVISVYHISLHILPDAFFIPINVYRVKHEMNAETHAVFHVKLLYCSPILN